MLTGAWQWDCNYAGIYWVIHCGLVNTIHQSSIELINQSNGSINQPVCQSVSQSINQSINQHIAGQCGEYNIKISLMLPIFESIKICWVCIFPMLFFSASNHTNCLIVKINFFLLTHKNVYFVIKWKSISSTLKLVLSVKFAKFGSHDNFTYAVFFVLHIVWVVLICPLVTVNIVNT